MKDRTAVRAAAPFAVVTSSQGWAGETLDGLRGTRQTAEYAFRGQAILRNGVERSVMLVSRSVG